MKSTLKTNPILDKMPRSGIRVILDKANQIENAIHLEIGQPCFNTPDHIIHAANKAAIDGYTGYTPNSGLPSLKKEFAKRLFLDHNISIATEQVVVSVGAMGALFNAFGALFSHGDEILVPDPGYPNYSMALRFLGLVPVPYTLTLENQKYYLDINKLRSVISKKTKAIVLNSPSNPTGFMIEKDTLVELLQLSTNYGLYLISDEAYDHIVFDKKHISPLALSNNENIISIYSCSKTYAMTGWRIGFLIASPSIAKLASKFQEAYVACAPSISQKAAEKALESNQDCVGEMNTFYRNNRDAAIEICDKLGIDYIIPEGAFYFMIKLPENKNNSMDFALNLLDTRKIAVAPGITFGKRGEGKIRVALCSKMDLIQQGLIGISKEIS